MDNSLKTRTIAGEPVDALFRALKRLELKERADGRYELSGGWEPEQANEAAPLLAALMRIEAELLLEDADIVAKGGRNSRTPPQRSAAALVELARRLIDSERTA